MRRYESTLSSLSGGSEEWGYWEEEENEFQVKKARSMTCSESSESFSSTSEESEDIPEEPMTKNDEILNKGLAKLNTWLWDSCELGVAAWMRAGRKYEDNSQEKRRRRRGRTYFVTDDRKTGPQQLWCVTPLDDVKLSHWISVETALTPRLCPRVFSREFLGGIIVGASLGSIRIVRSGLTGIRWIEFLVMVCVGDECQRVWRKENDFRRYIQKYWSTLSIDCKSAYSLTEGHRQWFYSIDDYKYHASRYAALESLLRELLFSADVPTRILDLLGSTDQNLGPPPSLAEVRTRNTDCTNIMQQEDTDNLEQGNNLEDILDDLMDKDYAALFGSKSDDFHNDHRRDVTANDSVNNIISPLSAYTSSKRSATISRRSKVPPLLSAGISSCCLLSKFNPHNGLQKNNRRKCILRNRVPSSVFRRRQSIQGAKPPKQRNHHSRNTLLHGSNNPHLFSTAHQEDGLTAQSRNFKEGSCCIFNSNSIHFSKAFQIPSSESLSSLLPDYSLNESDTKLGSENFAAPLTVALQLWCYQHDDGRIEVIDRRVAVSSKQDAEIESTKFNKHISDIHPLFAKAPPEFNPTAADAAATACTPYEQLHNCQPCTLIA